MVIFWPHTNKLAVASFRLRCSMVAQELRKKGLEAKITNNPHPHSPILVLSKRYDRKTLNLAEARRRSHGTRIVLDICDNHFVHEPTDESKAKKAEELRRAVQAADLTIASTDFLKKIILKECGHVKIEVIGDYVESPKVIDLKQKLKNPIAFLEYVHFSQKLANTIPAKTLKLIWFGNHGGSYHEAGISDLDRVKEILEKKSVDTPLSLTIVSNSRSRYDKIVKSWKIPTFYLEWNIATFSEVMKLHHCAIIPISPNQFTLAKTANRVTTALAHGLNVIADEIPSYTVYRDRIYLNDWYGAIGELATTKGRSCYRSFDQIAHNEDITRKWLSSLGGLLNEEN